MRALIFSKRTWKEIMRDPLSYIFCLGFPVVMLLIMTAVNKNIPEEAGMHLFEIQSLAPGIAVFGLSFVMLFACIQVSKDRSTAFLLRLYVSPMKPSDFIGGYTLPMLWTAFLQEIITFFVSIMIGFTADVSFQPIRLILCLAALIPAGLLFIGFGLLFGSLLSEKAAPGICSVVISVVCFLGGIWMDVDSLGGTLAKICHVLPFYHAVHAARTVLSGDFGDAGTSIFVLLVYSVLIFLLAAFVFQGKIQKDLR